MADMKISDLPAAPGVNDAQQFEVNDSGNSRHVTFQQMHAAIKAQADTDYAPKTPQHQGETVGGLTPASWNDLPAQFPYIGVVHALVKSTGGNDGPESGGYYYVYQFFHVSAGTPHFTQIAIPYADGPLTWRYGSPQGWSDWQSTSVDGHTHTVSQISDSSSIGRALMTTTTPAYARAAIGAGTSNLTLGYSAGTAKPGDWAPHIGTGTYGYLNWSRLTGVPSGVTLPAALGVGSYVLGYANYSVNLTPGTTIAGSNLVVAVQGIGGGYLTTPAGYVAGTWRSMMQGGVSYDEYLTAITLFMRIA